MLKTLLSPYAVGVVSRIGAQVNSFALVMLASRALELGDFGSYALAWALSVIFTTLTFTGIYHVLLRSSDLERDGDTIFWLQFSTGVVGTVVMAGAGLLSGITDHGGAGFALLALSPIPAVAAIAAWNEAQLVRRAMIRTTSLTVFGAECTALLIAALMFRAGFGIEALIASRYGSTLFSLLVSAALVRRVPRLIFRRHVAWAALGEAWPLWGSVSTGMMSNYGADLILGAFLNTGAVGAYRAGSRVANTAADVLLQPLGTLSWARFARLEARGSRPEIREAWKHNMALGFALVAPVMVSLSLLAQPMVNTLFDPSWGAVAGIVSILALARACDSLTFLLEPTLACLGKVRLQFYVQLATGMLLVALLFGIGRQSGEGAAMAILITGAVGGAAALALMVWAAKLSFGDLAGTLLPGLGLTALCVGVIFALDPARGVMEPLAGLLLTAGALVVAWGAVVAAMLYRRVLVLPTP